MFKFTRRHRRPESCERIWGAASVLLDYPTAELLASLDELAQEAAEVGSDDLLGLIEFLRSRPLTQLQQAYVQTFDHTRKCALYLTYFAYGDTRRRGVALVRFKQAYRRGGMAWDEDCGELPDHLCAVLQFGATIDPEVGWRLLNDHRAGVEMLRLALASWRNDDGTVGSPWLAAVAAVVGTLPELAGDEADAVRRLIEQGPPAEEVGLAPYDPTHPVSADLSARRPEFIGMPS
jgi:nitrate reductase delta subunit